MFIYKKASRNRKITFDLRLTLWLYYIWGQKFVKFLSMAFNFIAFFILVPRIYIITTIEKHRKQLENMRLVI